MKETPNGVCRAWHESGRVQVPMPGLSRAEGGGIAFPFEAVKVEFLLEAA